MAFGASSAGIDVNVSVDLLERFGVGFNLVEEGDASEAAPEDVDGVGCDAVDVIACGFRVFDDFDVLGASIPVEESGLS